MEQNDSEEYIAIDDLELTVKNKQFIGLALTRYIDDLWERSQTFDWNAFKELKKVVKKFSDRGFVFGDYPDEFEAIQSEEQFEQWKKDDRAFWERQRFLEQQQMRQKIVKEQMGLNELIEIIPSTDDTFN